MLQAAAGEVDAGATRLPVDGDGHLDVGAVVELIAEPTVLQPVQHPPHRLRGVLLHMAHVGRHHLAPELLDHLADLRRPAGASGDLGADIADVAVRVAGGIGAGSQGGAELGLAETPLLHQQEGVEQHALLVQGAAVGRHGARRAAADVGVMAAGGDEERAGARLIEHRHDHRQIGQVGAAVVRVVDQKDVAGPQATARRGRRVADRAYAVAH